MTLLRLSIPLLASAPVCSAATLFMTGTLHDSPAPEIPGSGAEGTFFLSLSDTTLTYRVSTNLLSVTDFDLSAVDFSLQSGAEDILLPILSHDVKSFSGCSLTFAAFSPLSLELPDSDFVFFPLGIADPGSCRSAFQMSVLEGSVEISPADLLLFDSPDFLVSVGSLGVFGRTDPDVSAIPEPTTLSFLSLLALGLVRRKRLDPGEQGVGGQPLPAAKVCGGFSASSG